MNPTRLIWIVDDDDSIRWVLERALDKAGLSTASFASAQDILEQLKTTRPDALLADIRMPGMDGLTLLKQITEQYSDLPVIIMTAHSDLDSAISAYECGAFDYLPKPFDIDEATALVNRAIDHHQESMRSSNPVSEHETPRSSTALIGQAPAMQQVFRAIGRLAQSDLTVLITGESGTGKELIAHALHEHNPRHSGPFVAINTAAIPKELLESELFGHERGAFTGAQGQRQGRFEQARGGTLFLDEIGDMPLELQTRLLRVLANGEFYRVGGQTAIKSAVRIIAATHQDLGQLVRENRFREDLYHRLNVIRIHAPALNERNEDIPDLAALFLRRTASELGVEAKTLSPACADHIRHLTWPGNVRQLENCCRWLTVMCPGRLIQSSDLPEELQGTDHHSTPEDNSDWLTALQGWIAQRIAAQQEGLVNTALPNFERTMIRCALEHTQGKRQDAAKILGWGRNTLTRKIKELGLDDPGEN